ncbi:class I SAM-dependent methyltransferase [Patescibacteria group bacterium]
MQIPFLNRWHPTIALRYLPMIKEIDRDESVLEVGSGSLGVGPYLKRSFTGVDLDFPGPNWPKMKKVKASATKLPFKDNSFDVVVNSDVLEHLPKKDRQTAINEMARVCKKKLIIGVPIGEKAHIQDKKLDQLYLDKLGKRHPFLEEQVELGLPEIKDIEKSIQESFKKYEKNFQIEIIPNMNLKMRMWLMRGWMSESKIADLFFRKALLIAIPFMALFNSPPTYRQIFIVKIVN